MNPTVFTGIYREKCRTLELMMLLSNANIPDILMRTNKKANNAMYHIYFYEYDNKRFIRGFTVIPHRIMSM